MGPPDGTADLREGLGQLETPFSTLISTGARSDRVDEQVRIGSGAACRPSPSRCSAENPRIPSARAAIPGAFHQIGAGQRRITPAFAGVIRVTVLL
jgi:hypothetical protein